MSRIAPIITLDQLKEKIAKIDMEEEGIYSLIELPAIAKDLAKVNFDHENYAMGDADPNIELYPNDCNGYNGYPCGYEILSNGLPVLFVNAGGDWECPVCYCVYWDGKSLRAYIPSNGNIYNKKEKCAYGSEESGEMPEGINGENPPKSDPDAIRNDIINRIKVIHL